MSSIKISFVYIFLIVIIPSLIQATETLPTQINLQKGGDSQQGDDYFIDADIDLAGPRLFIGYGKSNTEYETTLLNTTTKLISISSNPLSNMSASLDYSDWGQDGEINIRTYGLGFIFNSGNWSFNFSPYTRDIELYTLLKLRPVIDVKSSGSKVGFRYYATVWSLGFNYSKNSYSRNVSIFASDPRMALIFSPATMDYAYGFEKNRFSTDLTYSLNWGSLGLDHSRSVSAVDNSVSRSLALSLHYNIDSHWSVNLRGGQSDNSFSVQKTTFATLGLGYQF